VPAAGAVTTTFNRWRPNAAITTGLVGYEGVGGGTNNLNVRDTFEPRMFKRSLISPVEVYTGYLEGRYDLQTLGNAELYGELLINQRNSDQTGYRQLSLDYPRGSPLIPANLAFSNFSGPTVLTGANRVGVRAFIGFGNDHSEQQVNFLKGTVGMRGDLFLQDWRYDTTVSYSKSDASYTFQSWLTDRLAESLDVVAAPVGTLPALVSGGLTCRVNLTNPSRGCVPAPALTAQVIGGQLPQDWINYTWRGVTGNTTYDETVATVNIDGPVFDLPAGKVIAAIGAEYRDASINDTPNINSQQGNLYNLTSSAITRGSDSVWELYGELEFPLLRDLPFAKDLTLNLSGRYTDYQSYGDDTTYKVGLSYVATNWLSMRATYGTSYRAPALFEQFQGGTSGFLSSQTDPCNNYGADPTSIRGINCASEGLPPDFTATSSVAVITAGGADQGLSAETSDNFTAGIILQPQMPDSWGSLDFAVDYYNIEINNGVDRVGASNLLSLCYDDPAFRAGGSYCRYIDPRNPSSNALTVHDSYTNIATQVVEGIDYNVRYTHDLGPGSLRLNLAITQYLSQKSRLFKVDPWDEVNGTINSPEFTGQFDMTYAWSNWTVRYGLEWIAGMDSQKYLGLEQGKSSGYDFVVPDYFLHHMSVQYRSDDNWETTFGVRNLLNETPPWISQGAYSRVGNGPLYSGYDYSGREVFLNVSKKF
jgi:iron complex outermembrane receptor protein